MKDFQYNLVLNFLLLTVFFSKNKISSVKVVHGVTDFQPCYNSEFSEYEVEDIQFLNQALNKLSGGDILGSMMSGFKNLQ